jgi:hypothetical protein
MKKPKTSTVILVLSIIMITIYAIVDFVMQFSLGFEVSPTLTVAWFAFWGTEIVALASIKNTKTKNQKETTEEVEK